MTRPSEDPFYAEVVAPPGPGVLVRARPVQIANISPELAVRAWQVVYGSIGTLGRPNAVSGTVFVPATPWEQPGPRPILSYGVGVHGLGQDCAPSHLLREGREFELPMIEQALERGWAVAVSDGEGLGMPGPHTYGAGRAGGHALLATGPGAMWTVPDADDHTPVLLWGYSEGGRNAAWAAELQPRHAPELRLVGVAAGGVPADLFEVARAIDGGLFSGLNLAVIVGLAHAHQDPALWSILSEAGRTRAARAATLDVIGIVLDYPEPLHAHTWSDDPWDDAAWLAVLAAERNGGQRPAAPVYLYHAPGDELVPVQVGRRLAESYARLGARAIWAEVPADNHLMGGPIGAPAAVAWLSAQLVTEALVSARRGG